MPPARGRARAICSLQPPQNNKHWRVWPVEGRGLACSSG